MSKVSTLCEDLIEDEDIPLELDDHLEHLKSVIKGKMTRQIKTYDTNKIKAYYQKIGKLKFQVYVKELEENECDINRGDYIGLQVTPEHMEYFIVTNDGRVNYDNKHTMMGITPYYRNIECSTVSDITETKNL
jgi:hypothetical protein